MAKLYRLDDRQRHSRRSPSALAFNRTELNLLLSLYSRRVMSGEWRDYAIDLQSGTAVFSVYRHSHERPLYTITKRWSSPHQSVEYLVIRNHCPLAQAACLDEALSAIAGSTERMPQSAANGAL